MTWTVTPTEKTWSYSGDPTASPLDEVRALIGDVDENFPLLSDDEINACIGSETGSMDAPAATACDRIVARFSKYPQSAIAGDVTLNPQAIVTQYTALAKSLRMSGLNILAGGLADVDEDRLHRRRRKPFREGMFEDRESLP